MIKQYIKIAQCYFIRCVLKLGYIFPIKKKRLLFNAYSGKGITCNPKYIYLKLYEKYDDKLEYVWCLKNDNFDNELPGSIIAVKPNSLRFIYYVLTSKIYINNGIAPSYIPFRSSQCVIGTWHGGGAYKKGGLDTNSSWENERILSLVASNVTYTLSSCKSFDNVLKNAFKIPPQKILHLGLPRNDIFFNTNKDIVIEIKKKLKIKTNVNVVLYAPTFRSDLTGIEHNFHAGDYTLNYAETIKSLKHRFGGEWIFMFRSHYYLSGITLPDNVIDVSDYEDMQELLLVSDVLINDYSSSMWDFSLMKKPCFIFAPDVEKYIKERSFYTPISEWPFPIANTNQQLQENICSFNYEKYLVAVKKHHANLGSYEQGTASQKVCEIIKSRMEEK